jgi:hypothetical protein
MKDGISILLVDYSKPFVGKYSIRSLIGQKTKYKYEVILLTFNDYNYEHLLKYKCKECDIRIIRIQPHKYFNLSACRNFIFGISKYKYVCFSCLGSIFKKNYITYILENIINNDSKYIIFGQTTCNFDSMNLIDVELNDNFNCELLCKICEYSKKPIDLGYGNYIVSHTFFKEIGGYNDLILRCNDYELDQRVEFILKNKYNTSIQRVKDFKTFTLQTRIVPGNIELNKNHDKGLRFYGWEKIENNNISNRIYLTGKTFNELFELFNIGPLNMDLDYLESRIYTPK